MVKTMAVHDMGAIIEVVPYAEFQALRAAYAEAIQDISDWAAYASEYFQDKHDLEGTLKLHSDRLAGFQSDGGETWANDA